MTAPLDLEAIKARLAAATQGPWAGSTRESIAGGMVYGGDGVAVCETGFNRPEAISDANNNLITNAPGDLAALVAEVERLTQVLTALVDDSEGQQHRLAWQDACEVLHGHRGPEVG